MTGMHALLIARQSSKVWAASFIVARAAASKSHWTSLLCQALVKYPSVISRLSALARTENAISTSLVTSADWLCMHRLGLTFRAASLSRDSRLENPYLEWKFFTISSFMSL